MQELWELVCQFWTIPLSRRSELSLHLLRFFNRLRPHAFTLRYAVLFMRFFIGHRRCHALINSPASETCSALFYVNSFGPIASGEKTKLFLQLIIIKTWRKLKAFKTAMQPFDTCSHRSGMVHPNSAWAHLARWYISEREPVFACGYDGRAAFGFRLGLRLGLSRAILIPLCQRSYHALAGSVWQIRFLQRQHVDRTLLCFPLLFALTSFCPAIVLSLVLLFYCPFVLFALVLFSFAFLSWSPAACLFLHPLTSCHFQIPSGDTLAACKSQCSFWSLKWATFKTAGNWL